MFKDVEECRLKSIKFHTAANITGADIFKVEPVNPYVADHNTMIPQVKEDMPPQGKIKLWLVGIKEVRMPWI